MKAKIFEGRRFIEISRKQTKNMEMNGLKQNQRIA